MDKDDANHLMDANTRRRALRRKREKQKDSENYKSRKPIMNILNGNNGASTSENKITWAAIALGALAIIAQIIGQLFFNLDLGVNIDGTLYTISGGGAIYTIARSGLKWGMGKAAAKIEEAKAEAEVVPKGIPVAK
jgi:hypothetical protein